MKTQNLAVMFTDIQGFASRTSQQTREQNAAFLRMHDALLIVFASPTNSVLCGMAVQDRLWDYNRRAKEADRIDVRVAVNLGEVRVVRSMGAMDVFGDPVNIAARVEGEAEAGEVWCTEAVYLAMNKAEVPAEEMGYRELKGIPERGQGDAQVLYFEGRLEVKRFFGAGGRCGAGDVARESIRDIEERRRVE